MLTAETQSANIIASMENTDDSSNLSSWLLKRKSGSKSRFFASTNKRFFTLDFDNQLLFYKHSENDKKMSLPITFRDIVSVQPLIDTVTDAADEGKENQGPENQAEAPVAKRSDSKTSLASALKKKMPSFTTPRPKASKQQHGFVIQTSDKSLELLCSSKVEADRWVVALHRAMEIGTSPNAHAQNSNVQVVGSSYCMEVVGNPIPIDKLACDNITVSSSPPTTAESRKGSNGGYADNKPSEAMALPPKVPKKPPAAKGKPPLSSSKQAEKGEAVSQTGAKGVSQSSDQSEKEVGQPTDAVREYSVIDTGLDGNNEAWGAARTGQSVERYHDKGAGLSLQQRLEQLEFSDDEDDCDED